jgi:hypothetical protein
LQTSEARQCITLIQYRDGYVIFKAVLLINHPPIGSIRLAVGIGDRNPSPTVVRTGSVGDNSPHGMPCNQPHEGSARWQCFEGSVRWQGFEGRALRAGRLTHGSCLLFYFSSYNYRAHSSLLAPLGTEYLVAKTLYFEGQRSL